MLDRRRQAGGRESGAHTWGSQAEAAALASWAPTGAAAFLIDEDASCGALLLERIQPGTPLPSGDDPASIETAARLLTKLQLAAAHGGASLPGARRHLRAP